jgi:hypothetical protein
MLRYKASLLAFLFAASTLHAQETLELPFYDDFSNNYLYWHPHSLAGADQWHLSGDDGIDGGSCARFYITSNPAETNDDWLVSEVFNTAGLDHLAIEFKCWFHGTGPAPEFYFTDTFNGTVEATNWTQLDNSFWQGEWTWNSARIEIENPGETLVFAIRYRNEGTVSQYVLIDNFSIAAYDPVEFSLAGTSEHFEFYTGIPDSTDYWSRISEHLEKGFSNYRSIWERPNSNTVFPAGQKIGIYFCTRNALAGMQNDLPDWDCGIYNFQSGSIYLTTPQTEDQLQYYGDLTHLAVNELSQMALEGLLDRRPEPWNSEGFGLYEMGYRPNRSNLLQKLTDLGTHEPALEHITDISQLNVSGNIDLMASLFESKALLGSYFFGHYGNSLYEWWQMLKHFYIKDTDRVALRYSTEHFDYYAAEKELPFLGAMADNMEEQLILQENRFSQHIDHRINICIYDNAVGLEINNRTDFQGLAEGADKINSSHLEIGAYGLINHEFMHLWVNILSPFSFERIPYPGQFLNEGLAESTDRFMQDDELPAHRYKIQDLYYHYQRKYNREPGWFEIIDNAEVNKEDGFWVDAYALGEMYWRYMHDKYPDDFWNNVKLFLQQDRNWLVFGGKTAEKEGAEFIQFMKELAFVGPPLEAVPLPFTEDFRNEFNGWTLMRYGANDLWKLSDNGGFDDQYSAYIVDPYWLDDKEVDSWLVSPPLEVSDAGSVTVRFRYLQTGQGIKPEVFYAQEFTGPTATTDWVPVQGITWDAPEGQWGETEFSISQPPGQLFLAFRFVSTVDNYASYLIDNVEVATEAAHTVPTVTTHAATAVTSSSALLNGEIDSDGGTPVTQGGFYWSITNSNPDEQDQVAVAECGTGSFSFGLTGLDPGITVYFRAFAINAEGSVMGDVLSFTTTEELTGLPFFDDFSNNYLYWHPHSMAGEDQWHLSGDDGIDGGSCARFYITSNPAEINDDWLVSEVFNTAGLDHLAIEFRYWFHGTGVAAEFYYTDAFNGSVDATDWIQADNSFWQGEWTWNSARIEIENPGDAFVFAIRYRNEGAASQYVLIDNFSIAAYDPVVYSLAGTSEHFEFYTNLDGAADFHLPIAEVLERQYKKYFGHWNIPGCADFLDNSIPTKVYYTEGENIPLVSESTPAWKAGYFDRAGKTIYLAPLETEEQHGYYQDLTGLAVHTFAGYAIQHRLFRDRNGYDQVPGYFTEAFGLYETGYRPNQEMIRSYLEDHPEALTHEHLENLQSILESPEKDIAVSYVEGQVLLYLGYRGTEAPYSSYPYVWNNYLTFFYDTTAEVQIKKYAESEHFDLYCSARDTMYIDSMKIWLERTRQFYVDSFQMEIDVRYPLIVIYDQESTAKLTSYGGFNGGGGSLNISPDNFWGGFYDGYDWLLAHEFGHVFNDLMYDEFPFGFYHEGMANFSGYNVSGGEHKDDYWKIEYVFNYYQQKYGREPTLQEFINNPDGDDEDFYGIDCYFFGFEFIRFINENEGYLKLREFFNKGLDFNVFSMSYVEIESGYIAFLKELQALRDFNEPALLVNDALPFDPGGKTLLTSAYLHSSDQEVPDAELTYKMVSMLEHGFIEKTVQPGKTITRFTEADLKSGQLQYVNTDTSATADHFDFILSDGTFPVRKTFRLTRATSPSFAPAERAGNKNWLNIYPNPVREQASVTFFIPHEADAAVEILNVNGESVMPIATKIHTAGYHTYEIQTSRLSAGIYFVSLTTGSTRVVRKMVIAAK